MKVVKPPLPFDLMCKIEQASAKISDESSMLARNNVPKGEYFILHDVLYQAVRAIPKGTEVRPGENCTVKSLSDLNGGG